MEKKIYDFLVIGAGVVGASIFNKLILNGYKAIIVDKEDLASGMSKANSGLVHAGFDAKTGSLKAKLNVLGNKMYEEVCARVGVPLKKCGVYVLGNDLNALKTLKVRGKKNGVKGLKILKRKALLKAIPNLSENINLGLHAQNAYIVSPYLLTICLCEEAVLNGGDYKLFYDIKKVKNTNDYFVVSNGTEEIYAKQIINCAGAGFNEIAKLLKTEIYDFEFKRGEYYVLDSTEGSLTNATLFPLPSAHSKGVLITPTIDGNILVGPTSYTSDTSVKTTREGLNEIKEKVSTLINNINLKKTIRVFSGVRVIAGDDFIIENSKLNTKVFNVAGICSPGLSSAPAIAEYVFEKLGLKPQKIDFKKLEPYRLSKDLTTKEFNELVKKDSSFGKVVCKCENITEGDIKMALNRPIKCVSVDGVKQRVRAGMGRCQGGFCLDKVINLIAKENKIDIKNVIKDKLGSNIIVKNIKE